MAIEQIQVHEIVRQAVSKSLDVPEFQRDFVWDPVQVRLLAESLYRDYPVGSFLLWNSSEYVQSRTAEGAQSSLWIVDGQQRITALCILCGQKPYWWADAEGWNRALTRYNVMVNLLPEEGVDSLEFALTNPVRQRDPRWVEIRRILSSPKVEDLTLLAQQLANQLTDDMQEAMLKFALIHGRMQRIWQIRAREIPIIKITHEIEDVAEIFSRLNRAGTRVKEADVVLALAAVRNPQWVREDYLHFLTDLEDRGWDLDPGVFIRTMTGIGYGRARLKEVPSSFWDPGNLPTVWKQTTIAITDVLKRLAELGILTSDLLPSSNSLIPLFVLHDHWNGKPDYLFGQAMYWFLLANRDGRYSGSALTSLDEDVRAIKSSPNFESSLNRLLERLRVSNEIDEEEFLSRYDRAGNRFQSLMLYLMLFDRSARDWVSETRISFDNTGAIVSTGFQPQWHHIYPRRVLKQQNLDEDDIQAIANITVLNERTNVSKLSGKEPWKYIQQFQIKSDLLRSHLIPERFVTDDYSSDRIQRDWSVENYHDFLIERAQLLSETANELLTKIKTL